MFTKKKIKVKQFYQVMKYIHKLRINKDKKFISQKFISFTFIYDIMSHIYKIGSIDTVVKHCVSREENKCKQKSSKIKITWQIEEDMS